MGSISNLSGCRTHGAHGCPICGYDLYSKRLDYSKKNVYLGYRRFLLPEHDLRKRKALIYSDDDYCVYDDPPVIYTRRQVYGEMEKIENDFGKEPEVVEKSKGKRKRQVNKKKSREFTKHVLYWKRSIFFELPYWKVRHFLLVY